MENVVKLERNGNIAIVKIEEREYQNTFTHRLITGLINSFEKINQDPNIKVVIIHGYDNYFCCGGTKDELIGILEGRIQFDDFQFYDLLLQCKVPVISAMQGHAVGAGLAFGCYADFIIMARECIYSAIFMKYGFTPGMGATFILPRKFGELVGTEMLMTARTYYGKDLEARGVQAKFVTKSEVIPTAMELALELTDKPLESLKLIKEKLTRDIRRLVPKTIEDELAMHKISFAQPEIRDRIENLFGN